MKVVHFSSTYMDGWGYQENILPKYFKELGHDVCVISLKRLPAKPDHKTIGSDKYLLDNVEIRRIGVFFFLTFSFFITKGLYKNLKELKPDILFHHEICLTSLLVCIMYKILYPKCRLYVDSHVDMINRTKSRIWFLIYYKFLLKYLAEFSSPFVEKFYGVSNGRCDFLESVFKIDKNKIELLPIGADTLAADKIILSKEQLRLKYKIPLKNFIIISGGKMGREKGTDLLIDAVLELKKEKHNITLVLFGTTDDTCTTKKIKASSFVIEMGWCDRTQSLELLKMADVAIWPIHHTTLIEDSIACLTPLIIRKTRNTEHLINDNGFFIEKVSVNEIQNSIRKILKMEYVSLVTGCLNMRNTIDYTKITNTIINNA